MGGTNTMRENNSKKRILEAWGQHRKEIISQLEIILRRPALWCSIQAATPIWAPYPIWVLSNGCRFIHQMIYFQSSFLLKMLQGKSGNGPSPWDPAHIWRPWVQALVWHSPKHCSHFGELTSNGRFLPLCMIFK